jgi:hypothetical protein
MTATIETRINEQRHYLDLDSDDHDLVYRVSVTTNGYHWVEIGIDFQTREGAERRVRLAALLRRVRPGAGDGQALARGLPAG